MKTRPRGQRSHKLAARLQTNKENLGHDWQFERILATRLGRVAPTQPPRSNIIHRQKQAETLTHGHSGETLPSCGRHSKKPSVELPRIHKNGSCGRSSLHRQPRIRRFYTDAEEDRFGDLSCDRRLNMREHLDQLLASKLQRFSMQQEVAKLNALTRRCAVLRRDLVSVQSDLLTINLTVRDPLTKTLVHEPY